VIMDHSGYDRRHGSSAHWVSAKAVRSAPYGDRCLLAGGCSPRPSQPRIVPAAFTIMDDVGEIFEQQASPPYRTEEAK